MSSIVRDTLELGFDPRLLPVGGELISTSTTHEVHSPWDGRVVAQVGWGGPELAHRAVHAAEAAMHEPIPQYERAAILDRAARLLAERETELAQIISAEAGKPIATARVEAQRAVATFEAAAVVARTLAGDTVPIEGAASGDGKIAFTIRVPAGVVAAITPFNFPLNLVSHKVAPALAAGCAVVLKPTEKTPLSALALAHVLTEAGLPAGWLNVVTGRSAEVVDALLAEDAVRVVSFTGSGPVGWSLRERAGKRTTMLELGNATPVIVEPDADLERAAARLAATAFSYSGQSCVSVQRILVHESVEKAFREHLLAEVNRLGVGDPSDEATVVGPVIDTAAHDRILTWIEEARAAGAEVLVGGQSAGNNVIEPTVVAGVTSAMKLGCEEVFGPVAALMTYRDLDEAIRIANDTPFGLQAAVFTRDVQRAMHAARGLEFGGVLVNESPTFRADQMPYGGVKSSGTGKEGPAYAVREMTEERLVVLHLGE